MRLVQTYTGETVLEAARRRTAFVFDNFGDGKIIVSVSGGKDSLVLVYLALQEARRRGRRIGIHFLDEEVVYQATIDEIDYILSLFPENTVPQWLQVEFNLTNATSIEDGQLHAWEPGKHKDWMRPKKQGSIQHPPWDRAKQTVRDKNKGFGFYDVIENFERCYEGTAFLVGLRAAGEAPHRWRAVTKHPVEIGGQRVYWGTRKGANVTLYPIYDWNYFDVWKLIATEGLKYNRIYDLMFLAGRSVTSMRCSSLTHERAFESIVDLPSFEPKTYARLQKRLKGVALAQETGKSAKLFRVSKLPKNFKSWRTYRDFLLKTHPDRERLNIFERRFAHQLDNEYVARQQCRQLILGDYENNLGVDSKPDPRDALIAYYDEVL
jgi:predicted phosphoadenosine phosphosulfate sulfurtransferase